MATARWLRCVSCNKTSFTGYLVDALTAVANGNPQCDCGEPVRLHLKFNFGLGAGRDECWVVAAFKPRQTITWENNGRTVEFCPFLVITKSLNGVRAAWLPYWHLAPGDRRPNKYGQFAPYMDMAVFLDLLDQARVAGALDNDSHER